MPRNSGLYFIREKTPFVVSLALVLDMFEGKARKNFGIDMETSNTDFTQEIPADCSGKVKSGGDKSKTIRRCKLCRKTFKSQTNFIAHSKLHKLHRKQIHRQPRNGYLQQEVFHCKFCESNVTGLSSFVEHMKSHGVYQESNYSNQIPVRSHPTNQMIIGSSNDTLNLHTVQESGQQHNGHHHHVNYVNGHNISLDDQVVSQTSTLVAGVLSELPMPSSLVTTAPITPHDHANQHQSHNPPPNNVFCANDGLQIEIPTNVKALYFNNSSNSGSNQDFSHLDTVMKRLDSLHNKMDVIIKHLNIPLDEDGNPLPLPTATIEVHQAPQPTTDVDDDIANEQQQQKNTTDESDPEASTTVLLEGFPPSYSLEQAAKEQQQQEFYALTLSSRQAQQVFQTDKNTAIAASPNDLKIIKGKGMDLWVPASSHYLSQIASLAEAQPEEETNELTITIPETTSNTVIPTVPSNVVDKVFVESRSRANFAKNLTFAIYSQEERRGKNCTGRVFGKAQHKGQLDPIKLSAVKEATFRKYPCNPNLVDITWRKECITAIDSGLRNESRSSTMKANNIVPTHQHHQHQQLGDPTSADVEMDQKVSKIDRMMAD